MRDRNKTDLTHRVTKASVSWLDHHGFKPVETEVPMPWVEENQSGWVADLAAVITPTQTELINMKLIPRKPKWPGIREREQPGWEKRREQWDADWNAKREAVDRTMTCVVEVKTSRGDFRKDKKFARSAAADLMYLALAPGIAKQEEWPEGWGILELRGEVMVCLRPPTPRRAETIHQFAIVLNIAIRRDHHTRYGRFKEDQQEFRIRQQERKVESRTNAIARAMLQIVRELSPAPTPAIFIRNGICRHVRNDRGGTLPRVLLLSGVPDVRCSARRVLQRQERKTVGSQVPLDARTLRQHEADDQSGATSA